MRPAAPDPEIIAWLWSAEGQSWSTVQIKRVRHGGGVFAEVKYDHECHPAWDDCSHNVGHSAYPDEEIRKDIARYGISGVPGEWKRRFRRSG